MADDWIPTSEAAIISGYNAEYLRWLIREHKIVAKKFGFVWQVSKSSLLAYLREAAKSEDKRRGSKSSRS